MKIKISEKQGKPKRSAVCEECTFRGDSFSTARKHSIQTGHKIMFYSLYKKLIQY